MLFALRSLSEAKNFEKYLFLSASLQRKSIAWLLMGPYRKSVKLFFCITDKRKEEIDHLNYSQASDLSSFKRGFLS